MNNNTQEYLKSQLGNGIHALVIPLKIKIPIRATIKVNNPKLAVNSDTFKPDENNTGSGLPNASIESNAEINPKIDAKKPITKPSKLLSVAIFNIRSVCCTFDFNELKPFTKKNIETNKLTKIKDIIKVPPSVNKFDKKIDKLIICFVLIKLTTNLS